MHFALNRYLTAGEALDAATPSIVTATAEVKDQKGAMFNVILQLNIAEGWHMNANPAGQDNLIPTTVTLDTDIPMEIVDIAYPKGKSAHFEFSNEPLNVYEGNLTIPLKLRLKSNRKKSTSVTLKLTYQPCNETECLLPQELDVLLDLP